MQGFGFRVSDFGLRVQGFGWRHSGFRFRVEGARLGIFTREPLRVDLDVEHPILDLVLLIQNSGIQFECVYQGFAN